MSKRKPKLSQHFLQSPSACQRIVEALGKMEDRTVLEIGPGRGALTGLLAARAERLIAIELDRELAAHLEKTWAHSPHVRIRQADILAVDLAGLRSAGSEPLLIAGNLPYSLTSDILLHLFANAGSIERAVVMVQEEVADRLAASPGTRAYGWLSTTAQMHARIEKMFSLPPDAFLPPPKVRSAVVRMDMRPRFEEFGVDRGGFLRFLQVGFSQKRKTLLNNLKAAGAGDPEKLPRILAAAGLSPGIRAEAVSLNVMARLYTALRQPETDRDPRD